MTHTDDVLKNMMGMVGMDDTPYFCVKCRKRLEVIPTKTTTGYRKIFYCENKECYQFGICTVVAKKD